LAFLFKVIITMYGTMNLKYTRSSHLSCCWVHWGGTWRAEGAQWIVEKPRLSLLWRKAFSWWITKSIIWQFHGLVPEMWAWDKRLTWHHRRRYVSSHIMILQFLVFFFKNVTAPPPVPDGGGWLLCKPKWHFMYSYKSLLTKISTCWWYVQLQHVTSMCDVKNNILLFYFMETNSKISFYRCNMMLKYTSEIQTTDLQSW